MSDDPRRPLSDEEWREMHRLAAIAFLGIADAAVEREAGRTQPLVGAPDDREAQTPGPARGPQTRDAG